MREFPQPPLPHKPPLGTYRSPPRDDLCPWRNGRNRTARLVSFPNEKMDTLKCILMALWQVWGDWGRGGGWLALSLPVLWEPSPSVFLHKTWRAVYHCGKDTAVSPDRNLCLLKGLHLQGQLYSLNMWVFREMEIDQGHQRSFRLGRTSALLQGLCLEQWEKRGRLNMLGISWSAMKVEWNPGWEWLLG